MEILSLPLSIIFWKNIYREPLTPGESAAWQHWRAAHPGIDEATILDSELQRHHAFVQREQLARERFVLKLRQVPPTAADEWVAEAPVVMEPTTTSIPWYRTTFWRVAAAAIAITIALVALRQGTEDAKAGTGKPLVVEEMTSTVATDTAVMVELADGRLKAIGSRDTGLLVKQGTVQLSRQASGLLVYQNSPGEPTAPVAFNKVFGLTRKPQRVKLPDGSQVTLDPGTVLQVALASGDSLRTAAVQGRAYFRIAYDAQRPFEVAAGPVTVRVLGTEFMIHQPSAQQAIVGLVNGKVQLYHGGHITPMQPGQVARIDPHGQLQWLPTNLSTLTAFDQHAFFYVSSPLRTIQRDLEAWYQVRLTDDQPHDTAGRYHFGPVSRDLPLRDILTKIEKLTGHRLQVQRP